MFNSKDCDRRVERHCGQENVVWDAFHLAKLGLLYDILMQHYKQMHLMMSINNIITNPSLILSFVGDLI